MSDVGLAPPGAERRHNALPGSQIEFMVNGSLGRTLPCGLG